MSLIKKSDVKNHLSARYRKEVHLDKPASRPDAVGFSKAEPGARKANPSDFAKDFQAEHSFSGSALAPSDPLTGSIGPQVPAASQRAQT
jgi:hypothetical protein